MAPDTLNRHKDVANIPVVLVHGWGGSFEATFGGFGWREALSDAGRAVVAANLPGHGTTAASRDPAGYSDLASGLEACLPGGVLDGIGFSLGGKVLIELAIRRPARFRRLVIAGVGDNIFAPEESGEALADALEHGLPAETSSGLAALVRYTQASGSDPLALAAVLRRVPNPIVTIDRLQRVSAEVLVVNGNNDGIALPDQIFINALPDARAVNLAKTDYLGLLTNAEIRRQALKFIQRQRAGPGFMAREAAS